MSVLRVESATEDDMNEKLEWAVVVATLAVATVVWGTQYVAPKDAVLTEAMECMEDIPMYSPGGAERWSACMKEADRKHATPLLRVAGY